MGGSMAELDEEVSAWESRGNEGLNTYTCAFEFQIILH